MLCMVISNQLHVCFIAQARQSHLKSIPKHSCMDACRTQKQAREKQTDELLQVATSTEHYSLNGSGIDF